MRYISRREIISKLKDQQAQQLEKEQQRQERLQKLYQLKIIWSYYVAIVQALCQKNFYILTKWLHTTYGLRGKIQPFIQILSLYSKRTTKFFFQLRFFLIAAVFFLINAAHYYVSFQMYPPSPHIEHLRNINHWPTIPYSSLNMARHLFDYGYEDLAIYFFTIAETQMKYYPKSYLSFVLEKPYQQTKAAIFLPQHTRERLAFLDSLLAIYPYSWPIILEKAKLNLELQHFETAKDALALVQWLNPSLEINTLTQILSLEKKVSEKTSETH